MFLDFLHNSPLAGFFIRTLPYCLRQELKSCETVLDLGCGPSSPVKDCKNIKYSVGVDAYRPYIEASKKAAIHSEYICKKIEDLDFKLKSFDAVVMLEVLEHLDEKQGRAIIKKMQTWARKKVIVSTPNGYLSQHAIDGNPLQAHRSGWDVQSMRKLGFRVYGLAGMKTLRKSNDDGKFGENGLMSTIKYRPRPFWFTVAALSQIFTYRIPELAFELFCVKDMTS